MLWVCSSTFCERKGPRACTGEWCQTSAKSLLPSRYHTLCTSGPGRGQGLRWCSKLQTSKVNTATLGSLRFKVSTSPDANNKVHAPIFATYYNPIPSSLNFVLKITFFHHVIIFLETHFSLHRARLIQDKNGLLQRNRARMNRCFKRVEMEEVKYSSSVNIFQT